MSHHCALSNAIDSRSRSIPFYSSSQIFSSSRCRLDITSVGASFINSATILSRPEALLFLSFWIALSTSLLVGGFFERSWRSPIWPILCSLLWGGGNSKDLENSLPIMRTWTWWVITSDSRHNTRWSSSWCCGQMNLILSHYQYMYTTMQLALHESQL